MRGALLLAVVVAAATYAGHVATTRVETALALSCARASDGTDGAIAACFTDRGLAAPEDLT